MVPNGILTLTAADGVACAVALYVIVALIAVDRDGAAAAAQRAVNAVEDRIIAFPADYRHVRRIVVDEIVIFTGINRYILGVMVMSVVNDIPTFAADYRTLLRAPIVNIIISLERVQHLALSKIGVDVIVFGRKGGL